MGNAFILKICGSKLWGVKIEVVRQCWNNATVDGQFSLSNTLKRCGEGLVAWNENEFGNVGSKINIISKKLLIIVRKRREELLWKQRSRDRWVREGDLNTRFFSSNNFYETS